MSDYIPIESHYAPIFPNLIPVKKTHTHIKLAKKQPASTVASASSTTEHVQLIRYLLEFGMVEPCV